MREVNRKIHNAKIVIALRTDLLDRVLAATSDAGFQDEKYRALCLPLTWSRDTLEEVLELRINELVQHKYSGQRVRYTDLLPQTVGPQKERDIEYMLDRTLFRPRDIITFFNICMEHAVGEPKIRPQQLLAAEGEYSQARLRSLSDEWSVHYPHLLKLCRLLQRRPASFRLREIEDADLHEMYLDILVQEPIRMGEDYNQIQAFYDGKVKTSTLRAFIAFVLHRVGVIGLKTGSHRQVVWSYLGQETVSLAEIDEHTSVHIHKMFWRALGINPS